MSYNAGRYRCYVDRTTPKEDYVTATYDNMTDPIVTWLCNLYGMVKFNDLTIETSKGHRYFIGKSGNSKPTFAIGWAAGNTNTRYIYLFVVLMFDGVPLNTILDAVGSGTLSGSALAKQVLFRDFDNTNDEYIFLNYLKSNNFAGISNCFSGTSPTITSANTIDFVIFKSGNEFLACYKDSNNYKTYDYTKTGASISVNPSGVYFVVIKNVIANSDFNYISQVRLEHYRAVEDLFLYSAPLTVGKIYKINVDYYYCLTQGPNDGSYLLKLPEYEP